MGAACSSGGAIPSEKPVLYYFPIAARGEVTRMIGKIGGREVDEGDMSKVDKASFGSAGAAPLFQHGDTKLTQSHAIVSYMIDTSPKYMTLSPGQKAKDLQFNAIMDDIMAESVPFFFGKDPEMKQKVQEKLDKWFPILEGLVPDSGFVNGLSYPTGADFVCVILAKGQVPYVGLYNIAGSNPFEKAPKLTALVKRTLAVPEVQAYVTSSASMIGNPFGFPDSPIKAAV